MQLRQRRLQHHSQAAGHRGRVARYVHLRVMRLDSTAVERLSKDASQHQLGGAKGDQHLLQKAKVKFTVGCTSAWLGRFCAGRYLALAACKPAWWQAQLLLEKGCQRCQLHS